MQKEKDFTPTTTTKSSTPIPIWSDYNHYHDFLITLLSYNRKNMSAVNNIWEYEYV